MARTQALRRIGEMTAPDRSPRDAEDDFFCLRFGVWYPSIDCAYRTLHRTCPGCLDCEQGRFNHKRHAARLARCRPPLAADGE